MHIRNDMAGPRSSRGFWVSSLLSGFLSWRVGRPPPSWQGSRSSLLASDTGCIPERTDRCLHLRQVQLVQSGDHLVPMGSPPVDSTTGGTAPEDSMSGANAFRHKVLDVFERRTHEDLIAEGAPGQRIHEPQGKG